MAVCSLTRKYNLDARLTWADSARRQLAAALRDPSLWALVLAALLALTLAYQVRAAYTLGVGTRTDAAYVSGFNGAEKMDATPFRWSRDDSEIALPGLGKGAVATVTLWLAGFRPDGSMPQVTILANGQTVKTLPVLGAFRPYKLDVRAAAAQDADLRIQLRTEAFVGGDKRLLGVMVNGISVEPPTEWRLVLPAWEQVARLTLGIVSVYLFGLAVGISKRRALALALALLGAAAVGLAWFRIWVTPLTGLWLLDLWLAMLLGLATRRAVRGLWQKRALGSQAALGGLTLLFVFGFWIAMSGLTNPNFFPIDHIYRAHLMGGFIENKAKAVAFFYDNPQSDMWGGNLTFPYPPTLDVLLAPLRAVAPTDENVVTLLNLFGAFFYASAIFPLYILALYLAPRNVLAGLIAAGAWLVMPINFLPLSDGAFPNLFGQWCALIFLAALAAYYARVAEPKIAATLALLLLLAFMAYSPTLVYLLILLAAFLTLRWAFVREPGEARRVRGLAFIVAVALGGALLLYYGAFLETLFFRTLPAMLARLSESGSVGRSPFMRAGWALPVELIAHFRLLPALAALLALVLLRPLQSPARWLYLAGLLAFVPFGIAENWINLYNKHMLAVLPFVALGTGVTLAALYQKGWIGRALTVALMAYLTYEGLRVWYLRVYEYILPAGSGIEKLF